jgi:glycogen debranching enzyme
VCEVVTNVLWGLARLAMGEPSITPALVDRLWDDRRGLFLDAVQGRVTRENETDAVGDRRRVTVSTWSALAPLALPDLPEEIARRLIDDHLLDQRKYWLPVPPTSVSAQEPSFTPRDWETWVVRRYWRGPTWINSAWLIWIGLQRLGMEPDAMEMTKALASVVARERLREFYEPHTGEGLGAKEFGWSSLIAELVDPDPAAANSYL